MGYTHYWDQTKNYSDDEWIEITNDIRSIINYAEDHGIKVGDAMGSGVPVFASDHIAFNGLDDDSYETFWISKDIPEWSFCKTRQRAYDVVVVACLCYMFSIAGGMAVSSDGGVSDWANGLNLARRALPNLSNKLYYPDGVRLG